MQPQNIGTPPTPQISVILPVRNAGRYVDAAIRSIREQTFPDFELLILDDGSTDDTAAIAWAHANEDDRIRVIRLAPEGLVTTLNTGLREARGEWIARMDGDDIACLTRLERQLTFLSEHPKVEVLGTGVWLMGPTGKDVGKTILGPTTEEEFVALRDAIRINFTHPTVMFRRQVVLEAGGYSEEYPAAEDYELWNRLASNHYLVTLPEPLLHYRIHDSASGTQSMRAQTESWARAREDIRRRRAGLEPLPMDDFRAMRRNASVWKRIDRELKIRSRSAYRRGAAKIAEGSVLGIPWLLISVVLYPQVPFTRFKRQVVDGIFKRSSGV